MKIKTRFAPSPTGCLHIGGARTALYSWLFAKSLNGKFVLRIDDTDISRSSQESINEIISNMKWLSLYWDEGPFFQTKRLNRYREIIYFMLKNGLAYKCFCSKERIDILRKEQISRKEKPRYDRFCKNNFNYNFKNKPYVVRFSNPDNGYVILNDVVHGLIKFRNQELDDLIILRSDGIPTYNFCSVIDDLDTEITHVIRGEDHISNTPRQINIFKSLNSTIPTYAHIPIILGEDKKKLSKRNYSMSITKYRKDGFLPEAILNYLVRLGWSYNDREIFSVNDMKNLFSLKSINKSSSTFNIKKLIWLNHYYINNLPPKQVSKHLLWYLKNKKIKINSGPELSKIIELIGNRFHSLNEIASECVYIYTDKINLNNEISQKYLNSSVRNIIKTSYHELSKVEDWNLFSIKTTIRNIIKNLNTEINKIGMPLRIAITGKDNSPPIDIILYLVGKKRSLERISSALDFIDSNTDKKTK